MVNGYPLWLVPDLTGFLRTCDKHSAEPRIIGDGGMLAYKPKRVRINGVVYADTAAAAAALGEPPAKIRNWIRSGVAEKIL